MTAAAVKSLKKPVVFTVQFPARRGDAGAEHVVEIRGDRAELLLTRDETRALVRSLASFLEGSR